MGGRLMMTEHPRQLVISTPDFDGSINLVVPEPGAHMTFGHLDVYYWSPRVWKDLMRCWPKVRATLPDIVFAMGDYPGPTFDKFVTRLGFQPLLEAPCSDGRPRVIYVHFKE